MKIACKNVEKKLSLYIDGELPQKQLDCIKEHLDSCPDCMKEYNLLKSTVTELNNLQNIPLPDNFAQSLHMRLANENFKTAKKAPGYMKILTQYSSVLAGFIMVILVAAGFYSTFYKSDIAYIDSAPTKTETTVKQTPKPDVTAPKATEPKAVKPEVVVKSDVEKQEKNNQAVKPETKKENTVNPNQTESKPVFEDKNQDENGTGIKQPELKRNAIMPQEDQNNSDEAIPETKSSGGGASGYAPKKSADSAEETPAPSAKANSVYFAAAEITEYAITCNNINFVEELKKSYSVTEEDGNYILNINKTELTTILKLADKYGANTEKIKEAKESDIVKITIIVGNNT